MKRAMFFVLLLFQGHLILSQNLVTNPGLENWNNTDKPTGWTNTQGCLKDSVFFLSGNYSCRQQGTTTSRDLGQKFIIKPSTAYRFSLFYKTGTETTGNGCRIWCSWLDINKVDIADPVIHSSFLKSETWMKYEIAFTSPAEAGYFYLLVRTLPNSVTYWDEFIFEEDIVSDNNETNLPEMTIYPNPAYNYLIINNIQNAQQIDIQNFTGMVVWAERINGKEQTTISVSQLPDGIYLIKIITEREIIVRKFIKKSN